MELFNTHVSPVSVDLMKKVLESRRLSEGDTVRQFEEALTQKLGIVNPVAVNSGTSALHLALAIAGVKPGDEVILPAQTFVASGLSIMMQFARPVFADIKLKTGNIDADSIRRKINQYTRAIMPVHWGGYPCDMDEINAIADEYNLAVIEDAAHAIGAEYRGKSVGSLSPGLPPFPSRLSST